MKILNLLILFTLIVLASCKGDSGGSTTTPAPTTTSTAGKCTDVNSTNQNYALPCICKTNYTISFDGKLCTPTTIDTTLLAPKTLFYNVNPITLYVDQNIFTPYVPSVSNCTADAPCTFSSLSLLPTGLILNPASGAITGLPTAIKAQASYTIKAVNKYGSTTTPLSIKVTNRPPSGLTIVDANPTYRVGSPISQNLISYSSGVGSVQTMTVTPSLPAGLSLQLIGDKQWAINGTPTTTQSSVAYTLTATGLDTSLTTSVIFHIAVASPPTTLTYPSNSNCGEVSGYYTCNFTFGVSFADIIPVVDGSGLTFEIALDSVVSRMPSGINLSTVSGKIQTTYLGPFESTDMVCSGAEYCIYKIKAYNALGSVTKLLKIKVNPSAPPTSFNYPLSAYSFRTLEVISDINPVFPTGLPLCYQNRNCFSITPALPNGYSFSDATGKIVGAAYKNAKQAPQTYTITTGNISTQFTLEVKERLPVFAYNQAGMFSLKKNLTVEGAGSGISLTAPGYQILSCGVDSIPINSFTISPALPQGLILNTGAFDCANPILSGGSITGKPVDFSSETVYTVTGCNDGGCSSTTFTLDVTPEISSIVSGQSHSCAVVRENYTMPSQIMCWGLNDSKQLGFNSVSSCVSNTVSFDCSLKAKYIKDAGSVPMTNVLAASAGKNHTCFIEKTAEAGTYPIPPFGEPTSYTISVHKRGIVKCVGNNTNNQLGIGSTGGNFVLPQQVIKADNTVLDEVTQIASGSEDTCAISASSFVDAGTSFKIPGAIYCWGKNYGNKAVRVGAQTGNVITETFADAITVGENHACITKKTYAADYTLDTIGNVYCWGKNDKGQLANGSYNSSFSLTPTAAIDTTNLGMSQMTSLVSGLGHTCAYNQVDPNYQSVTGSLKCWGDNSFGQVVGSNANALAFPKGQDIIGLNGNGILTNPFMMGAGSNFTLINVNAGSTNYLAMFGKFALPNTPFSGISSTYPVEIMMDYGISGLSNFYTNGIIQVGPSADSFACSVQSSNGNLYCWGKNDKAQLGTNSNVDAVYPTKVQFDFN